MILKTVKIKNYRSLEHVEIEMQPTCRILVGINESGKSNILKALALIDENVNPSKSDIRQILPNEDLIKWAGVSFIFELNPPEQKLIYSGCSTRVLNKQKTRAILKMGKRKLSLQELCEQNNQAAYHISLIRKVKFASNHEWDDDCTITGNWKKVSESCPGDVQVPISKTVSVTLAECSIVNCDDYPDIPEELLEDATAHDVEELIKTQIKNIVLSNLPESVFWTYDEKNLLPPSVDCDEFIGDPDTCLPLKNMFVLAGIDDIAAAVTEAKGDSTNTYRNLLAMVADRATVHFKKIWKEYGDVRFVLVQNGANIDTAVKEKNHFDFAQRSDGFKRFVSFLLLVSTKVRTKSLQNTLLLIDEPDVGLHPSSIRDLRDELINISDTNTVVFSTHSIFMIDREIISRHVIVKKTNEVTVVSDANESNYFDEEVIYNALGYSIFETLKDVNIIFEGWRDKRLFVVALKKTGVFSRDEKKAAKDLGLCHAKGVPHIKSITPIMEMNSRKCLIVSDSDEAGKIMKREYLKIRGYGTWSTYNDIDKTCVAMTGEDFIKEAVFLSAVKEVQKTVTGLKLNLTGFDPTNRVDCLKKRLKSSGIEGKPAKMFIDGVKNAIFDGLSPGDIDDSYIVIVKGIIETTQHM